MQAQLLLELQGARAGQAYAIPDLAVELHTPTDIGVPVQWWRFVGSTHTAFSTECFIDELAQAAREAGWGSPLEARAGLRRWRRYCRRGLDAA